MRPAVRHWFVRSGSSGRRFYRYRSRIQRTTTRTHPRSRRGSLFDVSIGHDNLFHGDKYKVSLQITAINITNKYALYNFLSTFSGTHYVTPRALTAQLGFHF